MNNGKQSLKSHPVCFNALTLKIFLGFITSFVKIINTRIDITASHMQAK